MAGPPGPAEPSGSRRPYASFIPDGANPHRGFMPAPLPLAPTRRRRGRMLDLLLAVLGTGLILAMGAYALLCDRI